MELPGRSGTINEYENNSLQSADGNAEQMETSLEYNTVYEVTSMTDAKDNQESNEMMANPAYETRRYNRLFSWARKKQQVQSNNDQVYKGKPSNLLPMVLLLLLCIVACSLSVTALVVTKIEVAGLKGEIKILQEEAQNVTTTFQSLEAVDLKDPKIQQLEDNVTRLSANQQELQQEQIVLLSSLDNLTAQVNSMMNSSTRQSTSISLYQACYDDTTVCTANGNNYWSQCFTNSQPITRYGFFTLSMHCEQSCNRDDSSLLKSTYIRPDGQGNVQCACEVTNPIKNTPGHAILPSGLVYTCNLVITRCPTVIEVL